MSKNWNEMYTCDSSESYQYHTCASIEIEVKTQPEDAIFDERRAWHHSEDKKWQMWINSKETSAVEAKMITEIVYNLRKRFKLFPV